jgi:hypothetical protein
VEWWVLDWNTPSIDFYRSLGAEPQDGWTVYRLDGDALAALGGAALGAPAAPATASASATPTTPAPSTAAETTAPHGAR